mmetsp:Transcript_5396/g.9925  ORF Transcript_5396/g.9925 Transcript_5396/m.9925 type:complete len:782 (+) Transcript_5396:116-2461(+)
MAESNDEFKNWKAVLDKQSGKWYYYNRVTQKTQWDEPEAVRNQRKITPWRYKVDEASGKTYYYNKKTKERYWDKPEGFDGVPANPLAHAYKNKGDGGGGAAKAKAAASNGGAAAAKVEKKAQPALTAQQPKPQPKPQQAAAAQPQRAAAAGADADFQKAAFSDSDDEEVGPSQGAKKKKGGEEVTYNNDDAGGFDENLMESFDKALEKQNPANLVAMIKLRHDIFRKKTRQEEEEEDSDEEEGVGAPGYELTKHRKGWVNRVFRLGKAHDADQLLTFKKSLIKKSLLKTNRQHDEQAIQMFKNIMSFMGDRKSSKPPSAHARKIIKNALLAPIGMRDEIYLQICKQTHLHPKENHCLEGWNLMIICLHSFPPSKNIKVSEYLKKAIEMSSSTEIKERAELARVLLDVIEDFGERQEVPPEIEVEAIRQMKLIELPIHLPDDGTNTNRTTITIKVDPFTTVAEAEQMMHRRLGLTFTQAFGLFEANDERQDVLSSARRVMDVVSSWDKSLEEEEKVQDVKVNQKKSKHKKLEVEFEQKIEYQYLLYQAKLSLHTSGPDRIEDLLRDPKAVNILYNQAKRDVMEGRILPEEKDITKLAAIKLQVDEGDYMPDIHRAGYLISKMKDYIPNTKMPKNSKSKKGEAKLKTYEQKILHKYEKLKGFTPQIAKRNFLDYVERWPTYGAQFFEVQQNKQLKSYPDILNLGISPNGILLQNPQDKEILDSYTYKEVVTWGHSESKFILSVGDVVQHKKLVFKTHKGEIIRNLIHSYIHFKVQSKMQAFKK